MPKATHQGTCQICGRFQKLPNNLLSQHGYTVQWQTFEGICPGSKSQPYEKSCDLLETYVISVEHQLKDLQKRLETLLLPATEPKAWLKVYSTQTYAYTWVEAHLFSESIRSAQESWIEVYAEFYEGGEMKRKKLSTDCEQIADLTKELNGKYIKQVLKPRIGILNAHLEWCEKRIDTWALSELVPLG